MSSSSPPAAKKIRKEFDFSRHGRRKVALLVAYLGWDYDGLVRQATTERTVEEALLRALERTKLLQSRDEADISLCGRTDKGVSAFHQVIALKLRSNLSQGLGVEAPLQPSQASSSSSEELEYAGLINRCLPPEIRVLAWAPVPGDFSARHNCTRRVYKYLLPASSLDTAAMAAAADHLVGEHDFRHFAKAERGSTEESRKPTVRRIFAAQLSGLGGAPLSSATGYDLVELTVEGSGFLWHQIRCIVAVLLAVGEGRESPDVVREMLDVEANPTKPRYGLASELPLCLFHAEYGGAELAWRWELSSLARIVATLEEHWAKAQTKATMVRSMLDALGKLSAPAQPPSQPHAFLHPGPLPAKHQPFFPKPKDA